MNIKLIHGDCLAKLKELDDNSVDSVVTDPPYEIGFMSKGWDNTGIAFTKDVWEECLRVLKPGGHLLAFSHSRTYHRMVVAIEDAGKILDEQSGITKGEIHNKPASGIFGNDASGGSRTNSIKDSGGASRFFYCPKASKTDRNEGCEEFEDKVKNKILPNRKCIKCNEWENKGAGNGVDYCKCEEPEYEDKTIRNIKNFHPTVKPTDLMAYLVRLVTPKGGIVLDPFMGSGSTGKAAVRENMSFIGIEREEEYMEIAAARIKHEQDKNILNKFI